MKTKLLKIKNVKRLTILGLFIFSCSIFLKGQVNIDSLPMVSINLGDPKYYSSEIVFGNVIMQSKFSDCTSQDANGYIQNAGGGYNMFVDLIGVGIFPIDKYLNGEWILEWEGNGDVMLYEIENTLVSEDLSGPVKQRVYNISPNGTRIKVRVNSAGATNVKLWAPGGKDKLFHPDYISRIKPFAATTPGQPHRGYIRFMDWDITNDSPVSDWSERRNLNWASQSKGNTQTSGHPTEDKTGVAYEYMIALCNETDMDMWVCFPHQSDIEYATNLAHLIKTGIDLATGEQTCQPLNSHLQVYIEYSNEVWNWNFSQSSWVNSVGTGDNLDVKYVNLAAPLLGAFNNQFNDPDRVINVCATQTANPSRAQKRLEHFATKPANQQAEVLAITSYYKLDMVDWADDNLSLYQSDPDAFVDQFFTQLDLNIGPPNTAFQTSGDTHDEAENIAVDKQIADNFGLPVICYEGGSHINPKTIDEDLVDAHNLVHGSKKHANSYKNWVSRLHATGIYGHNLFQMVGFWYRYGQWGHMQSCGDDIHQIPNEYIDANTVRYKAMLDYYELPYPVSTSCDLYSTPAALSFVAAGESKTIEITSEEAWTIDSEPSWITSSITGETITITADANTGDNRSGIIEISGNCGSISVAMSQNAAFSLSENSLYFIEEAGTKTIDITTEDAWTVTETIDWLTVSPMSGNGDATLTISVNENEAFERSGTISITSGTTKTVTINQTNGAIRVTRVSFDESEYILGVGTNMQLNAVVSPSDAYDNSVSYSSLYPDIATVENSGFVSAVAEGATVITVTTSDGSYTATCLITVSTDAPTGIVNQTKGILIYPNPTHSFVNIQASTNIKSIEIYNCFGSLIHQLNPNKARTIKVNTNTLSQGIYIVNITDENNITRTLKMLKD